MKLTTHHIVDLVNSLEKNVEYNYIHKSNLKKILFTECDSSYGPLRFQRISDNKTKSVVVTTDNIEKLANEIKENRPFNIDSIANASGSWRSLFESVLANTSEFYHCKIGGIKHLIWIPEQPHPIGEILFINTEDIPYNESDDIMYSSLQERFIAYLRSIGLAEKTVKNYSESLSGRISKEIKIHTKSDFETIFNVSDLALIKSFYQLWKTIPQMKELDEKGNKMYSCAHKKYIDFLNILHNENKSPIEAIKTIGSLKYRPYITAIKAKPFVLLAGISGTGKSRIVRQLAYATSGESQENTQKPFNFEMIPVRPNWHDSSELLGYLTRVSGTPEYIVPDFLKFIAKAWVYEDTPFFLCLDEMNLAPVEQYFAEYLSVVESRKLRDGKIVTDPLIPALTTWNKVDKAGKEISVSDQILKELFHDFWTHEGWSDSTIATQIDKLKKQFREQGISIPQNLIVMGTVNMDETTYSFSRKVLDRAMTIEMNDVDLAAGLSKKEDAQPIIPAKALLPDAVEGYDIYEDNKDICDSVIGYLKQINEKLKDTPFKIAYRTRNEFLLYVLANLPYQGDSTTEKCIARALDEITCMKILSRIEGDKNKIGTILDDLYEVVLKRTEVNGISPEESVSLYKIRRMKKKLDTAYYCDFWS